MAYRPVILPRPGGGPVPAGYGRGTIADIIMAGGDAAADAHLRGGAILADAVGGAGQVAAGYMQERAQAKEMGRRDAALTQALASWDGQDPQQLAASLTMLDPVSRVKVAEGMAGIGRLRSDQLAERRKAWQDGVVAVASMPFTFAQRNWSTIKAQLGPGAAEFLGLEQLPEELDAETFGAIQGLGPQFGMKQPAREKITTRAADGSETTQFVDPMAGGTYRSEPAPAKAAAAGSFEGFVASKYGAAPTADQVLAARKEWAAADDRPLQGGGGEPRGLTANAESALITRLSRDYDNAAKPARELRRQSAAIRDGIKAARAGNMNAGQQTVLVAFQKMLDPLSVVREGEFARSASGQALIDRALGAYAKLTQGGSGFTPEALEEFAKVADDLAKGYDDHVRGVRTRVEKNAKHYNIPSDLVITEDGSMAPPAAPAQAQAGGTVSVSTPEEAMGLPPGTLYRAPDGVVRRR